MAFWRGPSLTSHSLPLRSLLPTPSVLVGRLSLELYFLLDVNILFKNKYLNIYISTLEVVLFNEERERLWLVGVDRLRWGRRGPSATQGTREVGGVGTGPLIVSGGTQLAHLTPPLPSHSPKTDPWNQGRTRIFSLFPLAGQASRRLGPQSEKGGVGSACFSLSYFFFFLRLSLLGEKSINLNHFFVCDEGKKSRAGGEQRVFPQDHTRKCTLLEMCVIHADRIACVTWIKPRPLHSFPYSTERKETQRICLHSRNARRSWEDRMSVPRVGDSRFTRKVFGGGPFPFVSSSCANRKDGGPHLPGRDGLASLPGGGRAAGSRMDARPDRPTPRTHGGRRGGGRSRERGASHPGAGERGGGAGPGAGSRAGLESRRRSGGARGLGGARRGFHPRMRIRTFAFPSPHPHHYFLKAKAVIYRPLRSRSALYVNSTFRRRQRGSWRRDGRGGEGRVRRRVPGRPHPGRLVTTLRSQEADRAPLF